jgi:hypothetical protein
VEGSIFALWSHSPSARDPGPSEDPPLAGHFRYLDEPDWRPMPDPSVMKVTNPFKKNNDPTMG